MDAGKLRHRIFIDELVEVQNPDTLEMETGWQQWGQVPPDGLPAEVVPLSGREFIQSAAGQAQVSARMTIRYQPGVEPTMRVRFDGGVYDIAAVLPDPSARRHITLMVNRGVGDGR